MGSSAYLVLPQFVRCASCPASKQVLLCLIDACNIPAACRLTTMPSRSNVGSWNCVFVWSVQLDCFEFDSVQPKLKLQASKSS
jgi:hypothetical protein